MVTRILLNGVFMADGNALPGKAAQKFIHPDVTADGEPRAQVGFTGLQTLWINTGTLCNVECAHCYIASSPKNDSLAYITTDEIKPFLDEAEQMGAGEIGFTGGEPFMNPAMLEMLDAALARGFQALVLTNAMRPMMRPRIRDGLLSLLHKYGQQLTLRVSLDHFAEMRHDEERGQGSFEEGLRGVAWLVENGFSTSIAGRTLWSEDEVAMRKGFAALFRNRNIPLNASSDAGLMLFPEMDENAPVPEITTACWGVLDKNPDDMMCAASRMVVKRKGAHAPVVLACTLLAYEAPFEMGETLAEATGPVKLNHPHCAKFCVLGGARCSG